MYGKSRFARKGSSFSRSRGSFGGSRSFAKKPSYRSSYGKTMSRPQNGAIKFATVGFARDVEKKYKDRTFAIEALRSNNGSSSGAGNDSGVTWRSYAVKQFTMDGTGTGAGEGYADLLKGVGSGSTVTTRIGNKISPVYLKGTITVNAATVDAVANLGVESEVTMGGEQMVDASMNDKDRTLFMRSSVRLVLVKDHQVNSTDNNITWNQVFESAGAAGGIGTSGMHAELNISNMGRFSVLKDITVDLTADDPTKTIKWNLPGKSIGDVRYNANTDAALTDKGIYWIWCGYNFAVSTTSGDKINPPAVIVSKRLCFRDA
ncbi:MAG: capsid protein [Cressdnaviricota sp.]|nr:MAG: capsid protein [Cressdnaviricota sp.]